MMPALTITFVGVGALMILLGLPLMRRKIPPNDWYGLRVAATFADEWVWYEANARSGRDMLVVGVVEIVVASLLALLRVHEDIYTPVNVAVLLIGTTGFAFIGIRRARRLLKERQGHAGATPPPTRLQERTKGTSAGPGNLREIRWAVDFESEKSMAEILAAARKALSLSWHERDKEAFGPYLWTSLFDGCALRIYDLDGYFSNGPTYTVDVRLTDGGRKGEVDALISRLLDAIDPRNRTPGEYFD